MAWLPVPPTTTMSSDDYMDSDEDKEDETQTESEGDASKKESSVISSEEIEVEKPKKAGPVERHFEEINRWCRDDHTDDEIYGFIRQHLNSINEEAGLPKTTALASELGDVGEAKCRARLELQAQYKIPQVALNLQLTWRWN